MTLRVSSLAIRRKTIMENLVLNFLTLDIRVDTKIL